MTAHKLTSTTIIPNDFWFLSYPQPRLPGRGGLSTTARLGLELKSLVGSLGFVVVDVGVEHGIEMAGQVPTRGVRAVGFRRSRINLS